MRTLYFLEERKKNRKLLSIDAASYTEEKNPRIINLIAGRFRCIYECFSAKTTGLWQV